MPGFRDGLVEVAQDVYAYLQSDGSWGLSNAGLVVQGEHCLLVDTLIDKPRTARMLAAMREVVSAAQDIEVVVNTHANGDHCWGNGLLRNARIIASEACAHELSELTPSRMRTLMRVARLLQALGPLRPVVGGLAEALGLSTLGSCATAAPLVTIAFNGFEFEDDSPVLPGATFSGSTTVQLGTRKVELIEVGPAHTNGDVIVHVPDTRVVFAGDVVFVGTHPVMWAGPVSNWIRACRRIIGLNPDVVIPGHGPITDVAMLHRLVDYFEQLERQSRSAFEAGLSEEDAAREVTLNGFEDWTDQERLVVNVAAIYREARRESTPPNTVQLFASMGRMRSLLSRTD